MGDWDWAYEAELDWLQELEDMNAERRDEE